MEVWAPNDAAGSSDTIERAQLCGHPLGRIVGYSDITAFFGFCKDCRSFARNPVIRSSSTHRDDFGRAAFLLEGQQKALKLRHRVRPMCLRKLPRVTVTRIQKEPAIECDLL
jgi:hypothetical protein